MDKTAVSRPNPVISRPFPRTNRTRPIRISELVKMANMGEIDKIPGGLLSNGMEAEERFPRTNRTRLGEIPGLARIGNMR
jgi:hypothetical protein